MVWCFGLGFVGNMEIDVTWITDDTGSRWVVSPPRKKRKSPRALKFADIKVGDQIMLKPNNAWYRKIPLYYVVTDIWFDPVAGQNDQLKGQMIGYAQISSDGSLTKKSSTPIRGLASQQFDYADIDYLSIANARNNALRDGKIVGIGYAKTIRARPKISGSL